MASHDSSRWSRIISSIATLTPTLSLSEGEGVLNTLSPLGRGQGEGRYSYTDAAS